MKAKLISTQFLLLVFTLNLFAQKEELYKLNANLITMVENNSSFHLDYKIIMAANGESHPKDTMNTHYYKKSNDIFKMEMGELQTVLRNHTAMLKIDHVNHLIIYEVDTSNSLNGFLLLEQLNALVDSAKSIKKTVDKFTVIYSLQFNKTFNYSSIKLEYTTSTNLLKSLEVEFNQFKGQQYESMRVTYNSWDFKWNDLHNDLQLNRFIEQVNGVYQPVSRFKNYRLIASNKNN
jgi:hypothetical protein